MTLGAEWFLINADASWRLRAGFASLSFGGKMWILGGVTSFNVPLHDVWSSVDGVTWTQETAAAAWGARFYHTALVHDGQMWIMGGTNASVYLNDVWSSTDGITWTEATATAGWTKRYAHTSAVFDSQMWVMGGLGNPGTAPKHDVWSSTDGVTWTEATSAAGWDVRQDATSVAYGGKLWVMGGFVNSSTYGNDVWSSTDGATWTEETAAAGWSARAHHGSTVFDGQMWVMGGDILLPGPTFQFFNDVWSSTDGITWTEVTAAADWAARSRPVLLDYLDRMWLLGNYDFSRPGAVLNDVWSDPPPPEPPPPPPPEPPVPVPPIDKTLYLDWTGPNPGGTYSSDGTIRSNHNWCPDWSTPATSMCLSRRPDGSLAVLFGTCDNTGRILRLDKALRNDDGAAIEAFYQTAYGGGSSGRNSVQYLTASVAGAGTMSMSALLPDGVTSKPLRDLALQPTPNGDTEWSGLRVNAERVAWRFGTFEVDGWFKMRKLAAWLRSSVWSKTRGTMT